VAKSLFSVTMRAIKAAERERVRQANAANRAYNAELKEQARAAKARERQLKQAEIANNRERLAQEKAVKAAQVASQLAEVESLNAQIKDVFDDLDGLLEATLDVDDYIDLETLRKPSSTVFDRPELEVALTPPPKPQLPSEPTYQEPPQPKGLFGRKKKLEQARQKAQQTHSVQKEDWERRVERLQSAYETDLAENTSAEEARVRELAREKERFQRELDEHNHKVDQFIANLSYGDVDAVQDYIAMVVENSSYPDHFKVVHEFSFQPETAELQMLVAIPSPTEFPSIKAYKYVKTTDEIRETPLPKTELKKRYCSAVYQVAVRSLHEVFEADRRGIIQTISLKVGTEEGDPATGKVGFIPFIGVSAEKSAFMEFDLSNVVPLATLKHLGAALAKDPVNLAAADVTGVRKS
jgi:restriction system protein